MLYYWLKGSLIVFWLTADRSIYQYSKEAIKQFTANTYYLMNTIMMKELDGVKPKIEDWTRYHYGVSLYLILSYFIIKQCGYFYCYTTESIAKKMWVNVSWNTC